MTAIGIDLGTTYSCVGVWHNNTVEILVNDQGNRTTPSYVAFTDTERLVGGSAKTQASQNPENTVFDAKRLIGRAFSSPEVQRDKSQWPFKVVDNGQDQPLIEVTYKGEVRRFTPEEISAAILGKMKDIAESFLNQPVTQAVITVPAYFNDSQRQATKDAGKIAGLDVLRIINEPTAAALAYGLGKSGPGRTVLIFDLGGGTFDVSLMHIENGIYDVLATAGDTHLGGEDFDHVLVEYAMDEFTRKYKKDMRTSDRAKRRLRTACETAKRILSSSTSTTIEVDGLFEGCDFSLTITRAKFEQLCESMFKATLIPVQQVLKDAKMAAAQVHEVVLVGGSTRIPRVQALLSEFFGGKVLNKSINPDEAVAYGAAIHAASLTLSDTPQMVLLDVTPLSLGVETGTGEMQVLIPRNQKIPCSKRKCFTTSYEDQTEVTIKVFEGERPLTKDNRLLGRFQMEIPPAKRGRTELEITYVVDMDGLMSVTASEKSSGTSQSLTIKNEQGRLSSEDVERMLKEAEEFKAQDEVVRKNVAARHALEVHISKMLDREEAAKLEEWLHLHPSETADVYEEVMDEGLQEGSE
jgi:L1 cell adhesion molecule like protein